MADQDPYPYPVYFQSSVLDAEQKKKIVTYFQIRRKSGGGECGALTPVAERLYRVAFKDRAAQQRVLQRPEHVVEVPGVRLVLTVRGSPPSPNSSPVAPAAADPGRDPAASPQLSVPASSLPPRGEEYELQLDTYLLCYLKENHKAGKRLEEELASEASSAQLHSQEGRVVAQRLARPDAAHAKDQNAEGDEIRKWRAAVDKIFERVKERYPCHYITEPSRVRALLQSCSARQAADVKVYSEVGMAVVVGERSQVEDRLSHIEDVSRASAKQTSTRRLGEAKLRLLWREIEHSLRRDLPGVKVTRSDEGQLVLEGSVEEILKAGELISQKESVVLERSVSDMSPHLLAYLRRTYGDRGVLLDFLKVGGRVEVELRDTEVRLFSHFTDAFDEAEEALRCNFKELNISVPGCSVVPAELWQKLQSEAHEMNRGQCRVRVALGSGNTVRLLGHSREVEELNEAVVQFILDHSCTEDKVALPFPELAQLLPEFLQLHGFDHSGVTFHPLTSSCEPMVGLAGPSNQVTAVRTRLGPLLDSLVQGAVTIDLPGAVRYFQTPSGRETLLRVGHSQKCLVQLAYTQESSRHNLLSGATSATYCLHNGLQVLVCEGDITKQAADALVNAANGNLDHSGGVAAALSKAGGPQVQKESSALVKQIGKIPTGEVVMTTGGKLNCKLLLHAVGPAAGESGGSERALLEKTVCSALNFAEMLELHSIVMPCVSSGVFGVPVRVCAEAIAAAVKEFACQRRQSLRRIVLIDNRSEVVRALRAACDGALRGMTMGSNASDEGLQVGAAAHDEARGATAGAPQDGVHFEIVQGTLESQQVDALVCPMAGHDPLSARVGHALSALVGPQLTAKFHRQAGGATLPGDAVVVAGLPLLKCKAVIFVNLTPWDNDNDGPAVQVLRKGISRVLASCENSGFCSVALPVIGTGAVLQFPHSIACRALMEEVRVFEQSRAGRSYFLFRAVIHPNDKESSKAFQTAQRSLCLRGYTNDASPGQVSFYRHVSSTNNEVAAMLGRVQLHLVQGDIINESTDVIVNTTDFSCHQAGVSRAILAAAGPTVQSQFAQMGIPAGFVGATGPGLLRCREIIHASFKSDPNIILKNCKKIVSHCESQGHRSAAFPAINTGAAGMDLVKACNALLDGIALSITDLKPASLSLIRIVILQQQVFQAFRSQLENRLGQIPPSSFSLRELAKQILQKFQDIYSRATASAPQQIISSKPQPAVMSVIGRGSDVIATVKMDLERVLQQQLAEREVDVHHFSRLDAMELEAVKTKVNDLGITLEHRRRHRVQDDTGGGAAMFAPGSGEEVYVLKGLTEDVLSVSELINRAVQKGLCQDLQDKEEATLALTVQWLIGDPHGDWQELSLHDNYLLEKAHMSKKVSVEVSAAGGMTVKVNLTTLEATNWHTGSTYKMKRMETEPTFELPKHWEPMYGEVFKKVDVPPNTTEYDGVAKGFHKTASYKIHKIERVQNVYLWQAYSVCKRRILTKNGPAELGEKVVYHGSSAESCSCIEKDRFDRNYAGTHAALYGKGVYFAVDAQYSAARYSPADASGLRRLYAAKVLTGRYTAGTADMRSPPPRASDPTDCFDSVVDNPQKPSMYVVFHDDQAYPEYLITFS